MARLSAAQRGAARLARSIENLQAASCRVSSIPRCQISHGFIFCRFQSLEEEAARLSAALRQRDDRIAAMDERLQV